MSDSKVLFIVSIDQIHFPYPLSRAAKERVVERSNDRVSPHQATLPPVHWHALTHPDRSAYWRMVDPLFRYARKRVNAFFIINHGQFF